MKKIVILTYLGLFTVLIGLGASKVAAANTGLQISPVTFNFELNPGESVDGKILVTNRNDEVMTYVMEKENFISSSEDGVPTFSAVESEGGKTSLADWISFPEGETGNIDIKKDHEVSFRINVPNDAEPGGHYGAVFAKQTKPALSGGNEVGIAARVGSLILVSVPGDVTKGNRIVDFSMPKFVWQGPIDFKMRVENTGSVHFDSQGTAQIKNLIGQTLNVDLGKHTILPGSTRIYDAKWSRKFPFGLFRVTPTATDGSGAIISGTAMTLIAIPLVIVIPALIALILVILGIRYLRRHVRIVQ